MPRLTLALLSDVPEGTEVKLDGEVVPRGGWGVAAELDPGSHEVTASGPRRKSFAQKLEPCTKGAGECKASGFETCVNGVRDCSAKSGAPSPDYPACDGKDHDCDGQINTGCGCTSGQKQTCHASDPGACNKVEIVCANGTWPGCPPVVKKTTWIWDNDGDGRGHGPAALAATSARVTKR